MVVSGYRSILIGDDHTLVAEAIKNLLTREFNVVGVVSDGRTLIEAARQLKPDIVLADIAMPRLNGLDAAQRIKRALPGTKIIFLTMFADPDIVEEAFRRGGSAVVLKTKGYSDLIRTIRKELSPQLKVVPKTLHSDMEIDGATASLTDRQRDVLQLLAEGLSMKEAARVLNLTTRTIVFHKYRIMQRLGIRSDAELIQYAIDKHLLFLCAPVEMPASAGENGGRTDRQWILHSREQAARAA